MLYYIETTIFTTVQQLSLHVYKITLKDKTFDFDSYFDSTINESIKEPLKYLEVKDIENYKPIFYKILKEIYDLSKQNGIDYLKFDISNRKILFNYWLKNKNIFLNDIINIYIEEQKS